MVQVAPPDRRRELGIQLAQRHICHVGKWHWTASIAITSKRWPIIPQHTPQRVLIQPHLRRRLQILIGPRRHRLLSFRFSRSPLFWYHLLALRSCVHLKGVLAIIRFERYPDGDLIVFERISRHWRVRPLCIMHQLRCQLRWIEPSNCCIIE